MEGDLPEDGNDVEAALLLAKAALIGRIAKEAIFEGDFLKLAQCPSCKKVIGIGVNFCWNCGQAVSWKEWEDNR